MERVNGAYVHCEFQKFLLYFFQLGYIMLEWYMILYIYNIWMMIRLY